MDIYICVSNLDADCGHLTARLKERAWTLGFKPCIPCYTHNCLAKNEARRALVGDAGWGTWNFHAPDDAMMKFMEWTDADDARLTHYLRVIRANVPAGTAWMPDVEYPTFWPAMMRPPDDPLFKQSIQFRRQLVAVIQRERPGDPIMEWCYPFAHRRLGEHLLSGDAPLIKGLINRIQEQAHDCAQRGTLLCPSHYDRHWEDPNASRSSLEQQLAVRTSTNICKMYGETIYCFNYQGRPVFASYEEVKRDQIQPATDARADGLCMWGAPYWYASKRGGNLWPPNVTSQQQAEAWIELWQSELLLRLWKDYGAHALAGNP